MLGDADNKTRKQKMHRTEKEHLMRSMPLPRSWRESGNPELHGITADRNSQEYGVCPNMDSYKISIHPFQLRSRAGVYAL